MYLFVTPRPVLTALLWLFMDTRWMRKHMNYQQACSQLLVSALMLIKSPLCCVLGATLFAFLCSLEWLFKMAPNSTCNAGDTGSIPGPGRSHMLQSNSAHVPQPLSLRSRAQELQLLSLWATTTEAPVPRAWALQEPTREATAMRSPRASTREELLLPQLEKAHVQ